MATDVDGVRAQLEQDPVAQRLLESTIPARLAYTWLDGSPRVVPIWFHWDGRAFVLGTPPKAPKLRALARDPRVSLTIDGNEFPYPILMVRGEAQIEHLDDIVPEYAAAANRYFGREQGEAWVQQTRSLIGGMARITIEPREVRILDMVTRFPSALTS